MNLRYTARLAVWAIVGWVFFFGRAAGAAMTGFCFFSPVFPDGGQIPSKYARTHANISPPLDILNIVSGPGSIKPFVLKSFVLIMDDPDAPGGLFTHWLVWNISPVTPDFSKDGRQVAPSKAPTASATRITTGLRHRTGSTGISFISTASIQCFHCPPVRIETPWKPR